MVYYALTTYHVLCCVLHKMAVHPQEPATLLLSDIHRNSVAFARRYEQSGIFDRVVVLPELSVLDHQRYLERKHLPVKLILRACCRRMEELLKAQQVSLKGQELYLCPDHFPFGWYVIKNRMPYHCFEEGSGVLSDREFALHNMKRNKTQYQLCFDLGCFGDNEYAIEVLADVGKQKPGYTNPKMKDFSVDRILSEMEPERRQVVLDFFGMGEPLSLRENSVLLLTQHMANLGLMTLEEQHRLYQLFADYLFPAGSHLVIKPHPDDIAGNYRRIFPGSEVLPFAMPSELMRYGVKGRFQKAAAAYSTSVRSMGYLCDETLCFDSRILTDWKYIPEYDCTVRFLQEIGAKSAVTNGDEGLLTELSSMAGDKIAFTHQEHLDTSAEYVVISDLEEENPDPLERAREMESYLKAANAKAVVFCQEREQFSFFTGENQPVFAHIRPITLKMGDQQRQIFVYTKEKAIMEKAEQFHQQKELPYTGVTVDMKGISTSEAEKIRVLEGVLAATEKRLNDYIQAGKKG